MTNLIASTNLGGGARLDIYEIGHHSDFGIDPLGVLFLVLIAAGLAAGWFIERRKNSN